MATAVGIWVLAALLATPAYIGSYLRAFVVNPTTQVSLKIALVFFAFYCFTGIDFSGINLLEGCFDEQKPFSRTVE